MNQVSKNLNNYGEKNDEKVYSESEIKDYLEKKLPHWFMKTDGLEGNIKPVVGKLRLWW